MYIYIFSCIISIFFTYLASKNRKALLFHIFAVLVPIALLSFRDISVGTDTKHYLLIFERSQEFEIGDFLLFTRMEFLFSIILFYVAKLGYSYNVFLFILALFSVLPVYAASFRMRNKVSPTLMMFLYYLMYYQYAFNISRQAVAMSLVLLATTYLLEGRIKPVLLLSILALGFHNVTIVFCGIVFIYILGNRGNFFIKTLLILGMFALYAFIKSQATYYEDVYLSGQHNSGFQISYTLTMMLNFILLITAYKDSKLLDHRRTYVFFSLSILMLNLTSLVSEWFFRISLFIDILSLIYVANVLKSELVHSKGYKQFAYICFAIFYWLFVFVINNSGESVPYKFAKSNNYIISEEVQDNENLTYNCYRFFNA